MAKKFTLKHVLVLLSIAAVIAVCMTAISSNTQQIEGVNVRGAYISIAILAVAFILFFTEVLPLGVTAMLVPVLLSVPGIQVLSGRNAFKNFGEQWVVTFMAIFVVGEAIFRTGLAHKLGDMVISVAGKNQRRIVLFMAALLGVMSAFLSNSATMALFAPVLIGVARSSELKPSQILMPMAFAICLGGNMTLMGASSKGVLNGLMETYNITPFAFFDYTPIGVVLFLIGLLYFWTIGYRLLPAVDAKDDEGGQTKDVVIRSEKMWIAVAVFALVIVTMASGYLAPPTAAMLGMVCVVSTGCLTMNEAYRAVNWNTIFLFAGMLAMGDALQATGADKLIGNTVSQFATSPMMLLAIVYILTMVITNFMSNTAAAAVATPIAISSALQFGVNPLPYCMAVGIAASLCFLTPVATPANTIAFGLGGYNFRDFFKIGFPLQVLMTIAGLIFIPIFFPFVTM